MEGWAALNAASLARVSWTHLEYDSSMACTISAGQDDAGPAMLSKHVGGPQTVEAWRPGAAYFRAPRSLSAACLAGRDVVIEVGALACGLQGAQELGAHSDAGLVRWLLCYSSTGLRRLMWARHEVYSA